MPGSKTNQKIIKLNNSVVLLKNLKHCFIPSPTKIKQAIKITKKESPHFQNLKKPTDCPVCGESNIKVKLTNDRFWRVECPKDGKIYL